MSIYKRNEFFGAILYDTVQKEYLYCDKFTRFLISKLIRRYYIDLMLRRKSMNVYVLICMT